MGPMPKWLVPSLLALSFVAISVSGAAPRNRDRDHDGMSDSWERRHHVDSRKADPDHDRLSNLREYRLRTNPRRKDTDRDGYGDGAEVRAGTNPRDPRSHPSAGTAPSPSGFPDASNTGVPAGTALSAYSGPSTVSTPNTVIDGKTIGCIRVSAPGVIIRRSKISCSGGYAVYSGDGDYSGTPLLIEDSEIDCKNTGGTALGDAGITARRVNIHGCENGGDINQNFTVQDSYIHDLYNSSSAHTDGLQFASGHFERGRVVGGSLNVTITHNTIYGMGADGSFGTSAIISNRGDDRNVLIENNLLAGGAVAIYCEQGATGHNYRVINNAFSRRFSQKVGAYGPSTDCSDETQSGNHYYETGQPLTLH
jgi:hypothetical protein